MKKVMITALVLCLLLCATACGSDDTPNITEAPAERVEFTFSGTGTEADPYQIATKDDLIRFAAFVNQKYASEDYDHLHAYYQLTADIILNDCSDFDNWGDNPPTLNWTPIGYGTGFKGIFDGNGHTVSGLYIHQDVEQFSHGPTSAFGLFGNIASGGIVQNLNIENAYVHPKYTKGAGGTNSGILAGESAGTIQGCTVSGIVICEGGTYGGIIGANYGEVTDCGFGGRMIERPVSANTAIGGIAGSGSNISNCIVSAELISEKSTDDAVCADMGGIVGMISGRGTVQNCTFTGTIRSEASAGGIAGTASALGLSDDSDKIVITNCFNDGTVIAAEDAGGIAGSCSDSKTVQVWIGSCTNRGQVRSLSEDVCAAGGIVGSIDTRHGGNITVTGCCNERDLSSFMVAGIVGRASQNTGNISIEKCINTANLQGEGSYAGGILCHLMQWGDDWTMIIDQCVNEGDIFTDHNAGGIVCFAYDLDPEGENRSMTISGCANRGNLTSLGINNFLGGILGAESMKKVPVHIIGCTNEGDLEYAADVIVDAETLSGGLFTLSRISGGIVGYVGTTPFLCVDSGERTLNNINVENAYLTVENCISTGNFIHNEARLADDVSETLLENWRNNGVENVLDFFIALEGGIVGTIADEENYSVNIVDCSFDHTEKALDDWIG